MIPFALLLVVPFAQPAAAVNPYTEGVWFNYSVKTIDVLIAHVHDPFVGYWIQVTLDAWKSGIALFNSTLANSLTFRVYWPDSGMAPPPNFVADIVFVPQGFMAIHPGGSGASTTPTCYATAPMAAGFGSFGAVTMHEFGHCLGLEHVFWNGVEYEPYFDVMGGGPAFRCPSNLNIWVLERVFKNMGGVVSVQPANYQRGNPNTLCTTLLP